MRSDTIFLINAEGGLERVPHRQYESEDLLQHLVECHPEILVGEQIDPDNPPRWLLIEREVGIPDRQGGSDRWAIDHLLLDQNGRPTFVEVKRSSDTRIRREVVGQMLDYAANAKVYWPEDRIRALAAEASGGLEALELKLREFLSDGDEEVVEPDTEAYWTAVERHLRNGEVRLLFVADSIPTELRRIIEFLNEHMPLVEVLGIEIRQYEGQAVRALVPRVIGQTEFARQQKSSTSRSSKKTTREEFLAECSGRIRDFFVELFDSAVKAGYEIVWGTKGFSIRFPLASGSLLSLFYGYPASEQGPAKPLFQAYLGFIENTEISTALRQELMQKAKFVEKGKHTLEISMDEEMAVNLAAILPELLDVARKYVSREA
ncbi:hypothetical protein [Natronospira bacteriovora]|uniref:DUF91 domain-containing protein n=1 Tax=Natronospira bacteriovora TaxID=3069753 RepID=A0ABU0WAK1_9GAMM|nr:hypothetical protein [Natronospira sp. AB-CW4]MDQ2070798.1 hypothetical protein [Natronospira sp. AB-CW4]